MNNLARIAGPQPLEEIEMSRNTKDLRTLAAVFGMCIVLSALSKPAGAQVTSRPISDFIYAQGTVSVFQTPEPDYIGWFTTFGPPAPDTLTFAEVDFAGVAARWIGAQTLGGLILPTVIDGSIQERPLADGRAEVTIVLHGTNVLTWANRFPFADVGDPFITRDAPPIFGYKAAALVADPTLVPALGDCHMRLKFINTALGAPIPDLVYALALGNLPPGFELMESSLNATANGPLRAASGYADGTPGSCTVVQIGVLGRGNAVPGQWHDGFPCENISVKRR